MDFEDIAKAAVLSMLLLLMAALTYLVAGLGHYLWNVV